MTDDVKKCVDLRINFFDQYFTVPQSVQGEVDGFIDEITSLGNSCENATEFEEKFASAGLSDKFNSILPKCIPKSFKMTKEQKQYSKTVMKEMLAENKNEIIKDAVTDVADSVRIKATGEIIKERRERMIEDGTFDEYTRANNYIDDGSRLARFLKNKFKKK